MKYFIKTYGCQMNELDSEVMAGVLERRGITPTDDEKSADLLIFNTCSVRDLAERKVMGKIGKIGNTRQRDAIIGVTGCMANAKKASLFTKLPHVDFVIGPNNLHDLDAILDEVISGTTHVHRTDDQFSHELDYTEAKRDDKIKAFVSIIRGCNKFCTYCIVPYTRGREVSRSHASIIEEVQTLVDQGYKEVTLLGQNVNSYGDGSQKFHDLLYDLDKIPGLARLRYMTSHPVDISRELMEAHRDLKSLCEFIHFPIQAGNDRVLKKMNRHYTLAEYCEKVATIRSLVPNVALGTDIIVGFPTETDEEFEDTYNIMKEIEYSVAFLFAYSPRKGTPATRWGDNIPDEVKQERLQRLIKLQEEIGAKQMATFIDKEVEVLVERHNYKDRRMVKGRTRCWRKVIFPGDSSLVGTLQKVHITGFSHQTLVGKLV